MAQGPKSWAPFYAQPNFLFAILNILNLFNYIDRGIIPGATNEFNSFIENTVHTSTPDVYLGLLQSSFIIGFIIGSIIFGHMIHHHPRFFLTGVGVSIWVCAIVISGFSSTLESYITLLFGRMMSGFGEAALQCTIPPWIQFTASENMRGTWLAIFFTAIPVGTALGYVYSSFIATSPLGWQWAFFFEAIVVFPIVIYLFVISKHYPLDRVHRQDHEYVSLNTNTENPDYKERVLMRASFDDEDPLLNGAPTAIGTTDDSDAADDNHAPSMWAELKLLVVRPVFMSMTFAYAAQTGVLIGLSTFGSAFFLGLGFFDTESEASTVFGVMISLSGILFTPLGGMVLDRMNVYSRAKFLEHRGGVLTEDNAQDCERAVLNNVIIVTFWGNFLGAVCLFSVFFVYNAAAFLLLLAVGAGFVFFCNASINMGLMMAVPLENRAFALAVTYASIHAFGDVPAPVLAGLLKDTLAPSCVGGSSDDVDDDNVAASPACRDEAHGLRLTMLIISLWLIWTVLLYALAWYFNKTRQLASLRCCGHHDYSGEFSRLSARERCEPYDPTVVEQSSAYDNNAKNSTTNSHASSKSTNTNIFHNGSSSGSNSRAEGTTGDGNVQERQHSGSSSCSSGVTGSYNNNVNDTLSRKSQLQRQQHIGAGKQVSPNIEVMKQQNASRSGASHLESKSPGNVINNPVAKVVVASPDQSTGIPLCENRRPENGDQRESNSGSSRAVIHGQRGGKGPEMPTSPGSVSCVTSSSHKQPPLLLYGASTPSSGASTGGSSGSGTTVRTTSAQFIDSFLSTVKNGSVKGRSRESSSDQRKVSRDGEQANDGNTKSIDRTTSGGSDRSAGYTGGLALSDDVITFFLENNLADQPVHQINENDEVVF